MYPANKNRPKNLCNNFQKGHCKYGPRCKYAHIIQKTDVVQELFSQLDTGSRLSSKPSTSVKVGLDVERQEQLRKFLAQYRIEKSHIIIEEPAGIDEEAFERDGPAEEDPLQAIERQVHEKYSHIPDGPFKQRFVQNVIGNTKVMARGSQLRGQGPLVRCSLERDPSLDLVLCTGLADRLALRSGKVWQMLQMRKQLPVYPHRQSIINIVQQNQVVIISGETGSGKTTQVAQYILDDQIAAGRGSQCHIVCTQPRRISAVSVAERVADERGEPCGEGSVGYQIRLDKKLPRKQGSIIFCTTGILLQWLHSDAGLGNVSHVIIDEIHERNMDSDFVMTVLREILPQRQDLKLILMSATLNAEQFCSYFENCPHLEVPGYLHPVEEFFLEDVLQKTGYVKEGFKVSPARRYPAGNSRFSEYLDFIVPYARSLQGKFGDLVIEQLLRPESEYIDLSLIMTLIQHICETKGPGAILVFLPGWESISSLCTLLLSTEFFNRFGKDTKNLDKTIVKDGVTTVDDLEQEEEEEEDAVENEEEAGDDAFENDEEVEKYNTKIVSGTNGRRFLVLPLHSKMPTVNQSQVFETPPPGVRKIIVATNIAETSITINDVVYIIDSGRMKQRSYDVEKSVTTLQERWVSKANADQRKGRAGRVQAGECYRLFTKARRRTMADYPEPEIMRTRLEDLVLTIKLLQLGSAAGLLSRVMDCPDHKTLNASLRLLRTLDAVDEDENLTPLGYHLAQLPLEPQIGKMILMAAIFSCVDPILSIAACLSFKEPFNMPLGTENQLLVRKLKLCGGSRSDHLVLAHAMRQWEQCKSRKSRSNFCHKNYLSGTTLRSLREMKIEFAQYLYEMGFIRSKYTTDEDANRNSENVSLLKAVICAGLYPNVAIVQRVERFTAMGQVKVKVITPEDGEVRLHRACMSESALFFDSPYLVYHQKMRSTAIFLHDTTTVSSLPLILFSHQMEHDSMMGLIRVNRHVVFHCTPSQASLIQDLKEQMQMVLEQLMSNPYVINWGSNDDRNQVLRAAVEVITAEDIKNCPPPNKQDGAKKKPF